MATRKPNVLILMSDQHHAGVMGNAGDEMVNTPSLDRLAARGMAFDNAFCQSPVCTPSRMSLLTGKNIPNCSAWNNHWPLPPEHRTIAEHFAEAGYETCLVGKMHFGGADQFHGFQHRPYGDLRHALGHQPDPIDMYPNSGGVFHAGGSQIPESLQQEPITSIETAAWIEEHAAANPEKPWFVCASYCKPHAPLVAPKRYVDRYRDKVGAIMPDPDDEAAKHPYVISQRENYGLSDATAEEVALARAAYYGAVEFLDDCIGMLLDRLEKCNLLENTIILYVSDHGDLMGNHGLWWKAIYYEEAIRVPFIIAGPGISENKRSAELIALTEVYPTLSALAGLEVPTGIDGIDATPLLKDVGAESIREHIFSEYYGMGLLTQPYKSGSKGNSMRLIRTERYKYVNVYGMDNLLFDLAEDPREFHNLAGREEYREIEEELAGKLDNGSSWEETRARIDADRERARNLRSGLRPGTPNQYQLDDGRVFDAEEGLYNTRWLQTETYRMAGIIPQMRH